MKKLYHSPNMALVLVIAFITMLGFSPVLTGCGGGSSSGGSGEPSTVSSVYYTSFSNSTLADGTATFTASKLSGVSGVSVEVATTNGQALSGLTVRFAESNDGYFTVIISDSSGTYQTTMITGDIDDISSSQSVALESGQVLQSKFVITAGVLYIAGIVIGLAVSAISYYGTIQEVSGKFDFNHFAATGTQCASIADIFYLIAAVQEGADLIAYTAATLSGIGAAVAVTKDTLFEIVKEKVYDIGADAAKQYFYDEVIAPLIPAGVTLGMETKFCWVLRDAVDSGYGSFYEMRLTNFGCVSHDECSGEGDSVQTLLLEDGDGDGFSPDDPLGEDYEDCNDMNRFINPGATEVCGNTTDEDCDGSAAECALSVSISNVTDFLTGTEISLNTSGSPYTASGSYPAINIAGSISGSGSGSITSATLMINGETQSIGVTDGVFNTAAVVYCPTGGWYNQIRLIAQSSAGYAVREIGYTCTPVSSTKDLTIVLTWNGDQDLDLHVLDPDLEHIYYFNHGDVSIGELDVDVRYYKYDNEPDPVSRQTFSGYGPETYSITEAKAGEYQFYVNFYPYCDTSYGAACEASATWTINVTTPSGTTAYSGTLTNGGTSDTYTVNF